jgi:hypothetical protein
MIGLLCALLLLIQLPPNTTDMRPGGVRITGRVLSRDVAVTSLRLYSVHSRDPLQTVTLAANRSFEFLRIPPGQYSLAVDSSHIVWSSRPLDVADKELRDVEVRLSPAVRAVGHATVKEGGPLPEFALSLRGPLGWSRSRAGFMNHQDGTFIVVLPIGEYSVTPAVETGGYRMETLTYRGRNVLRGRLQLAGQVERLSAKFSTTGTPPWRRIRGRVTGLKNIPGWIGPLRVDLHVDRVGLWGEAAVNKDGSFEFPKVLPGTYRITPPGLRPSALVISNADVDNLQFDVPPHRQVTGRLVMENGDTPRVESFDVTFSTPQGVDFYANNTNNSAFRAVLPEREFAVRFRLPPAYEISSILRGSQDLRRESLRVSSNEEEIRVVLRPATRPAEELRPFVDAPPEPAAVDASQVRGTPRKVRGRFIGATPQAKVVLQDGLGTVFESVLDDKGAFEFPKVSSGVYRLALWAGHPYLPATMVVVGDDDITNIAIPVPKQRAILGRVSVEGGGTLPPLGFIVWPTTLLGDFYGFTQRSGAGIPMNIATDGTFQIMLPEGAHRVEVTGFPARHYMLRSVTFGDRNLLTAPLNVEGRDLPELLIQLALAEPETVATVRGTLIGASTLSSPGSITLSREDPLVAPTLFHSELGPDGAFEFTRVPPGRYSMGTNPPVAGMMNRRIVVGERQIVQADLNVPARVPVKIRLRVEGRTLNAANLPRPNLTLRLNTGDAYRIYLAPYFNLVQPLGWYCISDACTTRPLGLHLNEPAAVSGSNTPESYDLLLPEGEHRIEFGVSPVEYGLKSAMQGSVDLFRNPLRVGNAPTEILLTFE